MNTDTLVQTIQSRLMKIGEVKPKIFMTLNVLSPFLFYRIESQVPDPVRLALEKSANFRQ